MANIILAPSGAGKSYFALKHPLIALDGDSIIKQTIGWPKGRWWETLAADEVALVHERNEATITEYANMHPRLLVLFNGRWNNPASIYAIVLPVETRHALNLAERARRGVVNQPSTWKEAEGAREMYAIMATNQGLRVFKSFDLAARSWLIEEGVLSYHHQRELR